MKSLFRFPLVAAGSRLAIRSFCPEWRRSKRPLLAGNTVGQSVFLI
ncbi:hypothetical protein [uncultured Fibrella sp.]